MYISGLSIVTNMYCKIGKKHSIASNHMTLGEKTVELNTTYRMDLNFRGTKHSRIENFRVFRVFIFADARPTIIY